MAQIKGRQHRNQLHSYFLLLETDSDDGIRSSKEEEDDYCEIANSLNGLLEETMLIEHSAEEELAEQGET